MHKTSHRIVPGLLRCLLALALAGPVALGAVTVPAAAATVPPPYTVSPFPNAFSAVVDLNNRGDVLTQYMDESVFSADLILAGGYRVGLLCNNGLATVAFGLNNSGATVGSCDAGYGVEWDSQGRGTILPTLAGTEARPRDINDRGDIVGGSQADGRDDFAAVRWTGPQHTITPINPDDPTTYVAVLNDKGVAAGSVQGHAAMFSPSNVVHPLEQLPREKASIVTAINRYGVMVGTSTVGARRLPVEWSRSGAVTRLANFGGAEMVPASINRYGTIVGALYRHHEATTRAVVWRSVSDVLVLPDEPSGAPQFTYGHDYQASAINDRGVIAGYSSHLWVGYGIISDPLVWTPTPA